MHLLHQELIVDTLVFQDWNVKIRIVATLTVLPMSIYASFHKVQEHTDPLWQILRNTVLMEKHVILTQT